MALSGFDKDDFQAPMAEINTTPLVDVMLVLLVIFLVTAPMLTQAIKIELPSDNTSAIADDKPITLSIDAGGQYYWDNTAITPENLDKRLKEAAANNSKQPIHLRADKKTAYEKVSHILAAAQANGLYNIGFVTEPTK
ncbi:MAG: biopolymer transporter ExbD [Alphaproteobacteria bacterium]|nr:biopolymer transporter ExbD [Alphaproteobacteria bacterium]